MKANQLNSHEDTNTQTEFENLYNILNKVGLSDSNRDTAGQRAENMDMYIIDVTANATASDDTEITHNLLKKPQFFLILSKSGSGDLYTGTGTNSETKYYVKCTTSSTRFTIGLL